MWARSMPRRFASTSSCAPKCRSTDALRPVSPYPGPMSPAPHRVYFIPGMFGFGRLAGYDYFNHVRIGLERRYRDAGLEVLFEDVPAPPTSSLRYRSRIV